MGLAKMLVFPTIGILINCTIVLFLYICLKIVSSYECFMFWITKKTPTNDRLYKIQPLIDLLLHKYNSALIPEKNCIDKSNILFKERLKSHQFISNKRHRHGIQIFKMCTNNF